MPAHGTRGAGGVGGGRRALPAAARARVLTALTSGRARCPMSPGTVSRQDASMLLHSAFVSAATLSVLCAQEPPARAEHAYDPLAVPEHAAAPGLELTLT